MTHERVHTEEVTLEGPSPVIHEVCTATRQLGDDLRSRRIFCG
jgi:hypothetical protein